MKNTITITVRAFPVTIRDERTGELSEDNIVLTRQQLQAVHTVGENNNDLIYRIFNRQGYRVLEIGKPIKREISVNLYLADAQTRTVSAESPDAEFKPVKVIVVQGEADA